MNAAVTEGACLARLRAARETSSPRSGRVIDFVLSASSEASRMSIHELARRCGVSPATITRLCVALGYDGLKAFQLDLAAAVASARPDALDSFDRNGSPEAVIRQVFLCNQRSLADTEKVLDHRVVIETARRIHKSGRACFYGIGESGRVAEVAAQRFTGLGLTSLAMTDPYDQLFASANALRGEVHIGISHTGRTEIVVEAMRMARQRGACAVALTNYPCSPLARTCEHTMLTAYEEHRINAAVSSSRIAQNCIIDALYFIVGSWRHTAATRLAKEAESRVAELLRVRGGRR